MITAELQKKIDKSIKLLQTIDKGYGKPIEVAYSGGKDSDVILQLAKEAGINYRAIYKNTTIDPPGTIQHVKDMGVEILRPKTTFFQLIEKRGIPTRFVRYCCAELKEYKVLDKAIIGVRKEESRARNERYQEPTECRYFGAKNEKNHVELIYPILEWTTEDVANYLIDRGIKCAPVYYDEQGNFHPERRLGCMACPLASQKKRIESFIRYPKILRQYILNYKVYLDTHKDCKTAKKFANEHEVMFFQLVCSNMSQFNEYKNNLFGGKFDAKQELENYFKVKL